MPQSYSHNTAVRHETDASRRPARSTRRTCRRTRAARSQHASRRSAAVSTRIVERRGPSRREGSAWKDDGRELRPWHQRHLTRDSSGADSRERRRVNVHDRPQAAATRAALEGQPTAAPRCACLVFEVARRRWPATSPTVDARACLVAHESMRWPNCTQPSKTRGHELFGARRRTTALSHRPARRHMDLCCCFSQCVGCSRWSFTRMSTDRGRTDGRTQKPQWGGGARVLPLVVDQNCSVRACVL